MKNQHIQSLQRRMVATALLLAFGGVMPAANAQLALNFTPAPQVYFGPGDPRNVYPEGNIRNNYPSQLVDCRANNPSRGCRRGDPSPSSSDPFDPDPTPFFMELVVDPITDRVYYHVLIGQKDDPNLPSQFSQEYYIATSGTDWYAAFPGTASAGTFNGGLDATPVRNWNRNFISPLADSVISTDSLGAGSGSGLPDRVVFNQVLRGTGFKQEVTKASLGGKPKITQTVNEAGISSNFALDMSALNYYGAASLTTGAPIINTLLITDTQTGEVLTNFDINTSSQRSNINAGKYIYNFGNGNAGSNGTYTYGTATYKIHETKWLNFWDKNVNISNGETFPNF